MFKSPEEKGYSQSVERKKPRTLHLCTALNFGGVERHLEVISRHANNSTYEHYFCALSSGGKTEQALRANGASVWCLHAPTTIPSRRALWRTYSLICAVRPDIIHTHGAEANFYGLLAGALARVRVRIGEEIGMPRHSLCARIVFRQVYRLAHCVIGVSGAVTRYLIEAKEVPVEKTYRLYNPVETLPQPSEPKTDSGDKCLRLCHVGRLHPVKNIPFLLEAIARVNSNGKRCELWLVGDGPDRATIENQVYKLNMEQSVRFLGYQRQPENFLVQCDIFIQLSLGEGFSLALVEAMRMGMPAIMTAVGGGCEIIEVGLNGWLVSPDDLDALVTILNTALSMSKDELHAMGDAAKDAVTDQFTPEIYLKQLDTLYRKFINKTSTLPDSVANSGTTVQ